MKITIRQKLTPKARLRRVALFWGLPFTAVSMIGLPFGFGMLLLAAPLFALSTAVGYYTDLAFVKVGEKLTNPPR